MDADAMRQHRSKHGLTRAELADYLGVTESAVAKWEQGTNAIPKAVEKLLSSPNRLEFDMETLDGIHDYANKTGKSFSQAIIDLIKLGINASVAIILLGSVAAEALRGGENPLARLRSSRKVYETDVC